jgi:hypothetical protein
MLLLLSLAPYFLVDAADVAFHEFTVMCHASALVQ